MEICPECGHDAELDERTGWCSDCTKRDTQNNGRWRNRGPARTLIQVWCRYCGTPFQRPKPPRSKRVRKDGTCTSCTSELRRLARNGKTMPLPDRPCEVCGVPVAQQKNSIRRYCEKHSEKVRLSRAHLGGITAQRVNQAWKRRQRDETGRWQPDTRLPDESAA